MERWRRGETEPGRDGEVEKWRREMWRGGVLERRRGGGRDGEVVKWRDGEERQNDGDMERWSFGKEERDGDINTRRGEKTEGEKC